MTATVLKSMTMEHSCLMSAAARSVAGSDPATSGRLTDAHESACPYVGLIDSHQYDFIGSVPLCQPFRCQRRCVMRRQQAEGVGELLSPRNLVVAKDTAYIRHSTRVRESGPCD